MAQLFFGESKKVSFEPGPARLGFTIVNVVKVTVTLPDPKVGLNKKVQVPMCE